MKIRINHENIDAIRAAITAAEGRAVVRTISPQDILDAVAEISEHYNLPKKYMVGLRFSVDPNARHFPNAYKYTPESTQFCVEYCSSGWFLTGIARETCKAPSLRFALVGTLTDEQRAAIIRNYTSWM